MQQDFFYQAMKYPTPSPMAFFLFQEKQVTNITAQKKIIPASRNTVSKQYKEFEEYINKRSWIWKCIPGLEAAYICNSMSFNALKKNSDIDVCLVAKPGMLRRTRFWSVFICRIFGIARTKNHHYKRFCLSFYLTADNLDMYTIRSNQSDFYLVYRIAHLIPLYSDNEKLSIYKENRWIQKYLPNHPGEHCIKTEIKQQKKAFFITKRITYLCKTFIGKGVQSIIKYLWLPIMMYKKKKLGKVGKNIIINNDMLKFYYDKRELYNILIKNLYKKKR